MKNLLLLSAFFCFVFAACQKAEFAKFPTDTKNWEKEELDCVIGDCPSCADNTYNLPENVGEDVEVLILEALEVDENCGCLKSGFVKYLKNNSTVALVKYGDGNCNGVAYKTICVDGDCYHKLATTCQIEIPCDN